MTNIAWTYLDWTNVTVAVGICSRWTRKIRSNKCLVQKNVWSKKTFGPKKLLAQKIFVSKEVGSKKFGQNWISNS